MFEVTRDLFHQEMAEAVFAHLREFLLDKDNNHCQRVEFLPVEVMRIVCERISKDTELKNREVEAYVLADQAANGLEIESGALIEKRNREQFGVLVAFIPQGLRLPAEDSYDIQTFKTYDLGNVLRVHVREMLDALTVAGQEIAKAVLNQPSIRRLPVDQHIKYLLALRNDASNWQEAGAYLFHLGLIPDLALNQDNCQTRLDRNSRCVAELTDESQSTLSALDELAQSLQLDPQANNLRENLVAYLRSRNIADTQAWLHDILADPAVCSNLNFAKWKFIDTPGEGKVEVHLDPLRDPKTNKVAEGFEDRGGSLVANTKTPIKIKWKTYPTNSPALGHFVVLIVRDTDDEEMGAELLKKTVKNNKKTETRSKISLKDIELAEGEACAAKIIVQARDRAGVILDSDESEPFWIEGGEEEKPTGTKKVNLIRNRAEAFFLGACRSRTKMEVDSEGWEEGRRPFLYRLKLKNREIYHLVINPLLHAIERNNISDPKTLGAWQADLTNRGAMELADLKPFPISVPNFAAFDAFVQARVALFQKFEDKDAGKDSADADRIKGVVEILDLREFAAEIMAYAKAFIEVLAEVQTKLKAAKGDGQVNNILNASHKLSRLDTIHLKVGDSEGVDQLVLLAPTHPIKLLWLLQYQQLLFSWADQLDGVSEKDAGALVSREAHERITSLNIPSVLAFQNDDIYVNSDNLDLYWSILPNGKTPDVRKAVSTLQRLLGFKLSQGEITVITAPHIADRIWRYLKHHPYVSTLRINVINPGDGLLVLNAIRLIQNGDDFKDLNYDVAFYADQRYEIMGCAFDEVTEGTTLSEGFHPDVDEELLKPNKNPLFPKLTFSKRKLSEADWRTTEFREAHITILIDRFSTKVLTRQTQPPPGSFCLHNLLAEYRADFDVKGDSATWSRKVVPNQNPELPSGAACSKALFQAIDGLTRLSASYFDWGNSLDKVPAIQLELSDTDKHLINHIHEHSDWVFTIDRNFGIEYFDNPRAGGGAVRSYLIDYTPEFLDGLGHRLIISTFWLSEIEGIISDGLKKMGIPGTGFHASQILDVLKSISGRLALKLINNPKDAKEIIGLALTRLLLQDGGDLKTGILIPVDSHIDLFTDHKRAADEADIRLKRSDLICAFVKNGKLILRLIEVKYRTGGGVPSEDQLLRDAIAQKNADTRKVFEVRFVPKPIGDRLDRELQNKELANLLRFYFDRSYRHGLLESSPQGNAAISEAIRQVEEGDFSVEFENAGYIFHTTGVSKPPEDYKSNQVFIIGRERILTLLGIEEDPTEPPPPTELPSAPPAPAPSVPSVPLVPAGAAASATTSPAPPSSRVPFPPHQATILGTMAEPPKKERSTPATKTTPPPAVYPTPPKPEPKPKTKPEPPPQPGQLRLPLGTNTDNNKLIFWDPATTTPKKLTNQHILIVGKSGAGKTQSASAILWELAKSKVPSIIFDFQGEYISGKLTNAEGKTFLDCSHAKELDAANGIRVNPLELPVDPHTGKKQTYLKVVYQVANSLAKIFGLGDIQHAILRDAISQAFAAAGFAPNKPDTWQLPPPSFSSVWTILKQMEHSVGGNVRNLNLRVQPLFETGVFLDALDPQGFEAILQETHVLRLSNLATPELMVAVSRFVLQKIYADMLAKGPTHTMRVFAVVDEAHKLSYEETLTELIREARKYGVGILLASQSVKDFDRVVFDMVGTKIALQLEGEDAKVMSENLGLVDKSERDIARQMILNQAPHTALVRSNHFEPYVQAKITPFYEKAGDKTAPAKPVSKPAVKSFDGKYRLDEKLGDGASGSVYRAVDMKDGQVFAVKVLVSTGSPQLEAQFRRELEMLQKLSYTANILTVCDFVREGDKQYLLLEYAEGGNLHDFVTKQASGKLDLLETKTIATSLAKTLQSIHEAQIVHRDLKPQNILRVNKVWKIADFGISKYLGRPATAVTLQGAHTPHYSAPEQIAGVPAAPSADIFSFGKLCLFMLEGKPDPELIKYITSNPMKNLIEQCIEHNPDKRPYSAAEIHDRLKYV